jgi:peroxin-14
MTETRSELLERATVFLKDTQQAPLAQRISFLESKGLTQSEIQIALTTPLKNTQIPPRPQPVTSKWPSIWWGPVALLALRYFIKYFNFPTPQSLQNETAAQKKEIEQSALNLVNLNDQTKKLYKLLETHSIKVTESLTKTQETLKTLEINNEIVKKRMEEIEKELESIKDCIPKVI